MKKIFTIATFLLIVAATIQAQPPHKTSVAKVKDMKFLEMMEDVKGIEANEATDAERAEAKLKAVPASGEAYYYRPAGSFFVGHASTTNYAMTSPYLAIGPYKTYTFKAQDASSYAWRYQVGRTWYTETDQSLNVKYNMEIDSVPSLTVDESEYHIFGVGSDTTVYNYSRICALPRPADYLTWDDSGPFYVSPKYFAYRERNNTGWGLTWYYNESIGYNGGRGYFFGYNTNGWNAIATYFETPQNPYLINGGSIWYDALAYVDSTTTNHNVPLNIDVYSVTNHEMDNLSLGDKLASTVVYLTDDCPERGGILFEFDNPVAVYDEIAVVLSGYDNEALKGFTVYISRDTWDEGYGQHGYVFKMNSSGVPTDCQGLKNYISNVDLGVTAPSLLFDVAFPFMMYYYDDVEDPQMEFTEQGECLSDGFGDYGGNQLAIYAYKPSNTWIVASSTSAETTKLKAADGGEVPEWIHYEVEDITDNDGEYTNRSILTISVDDNTNAQERDVLLNISQPASEVITLRVKQHGCPTIIATPDSVTDFSTIIGTSVTKTINIKGFNLKGGITATIVENDSPFSIDVDSISVADATDGKDITITYAPTVVGTDNGTLRLTSNEAAIVDIALTGTAIFQIPMDGTIELVNASDASVVYNGNAHRPAVRVIDNTYGELTVGTDYYLEYSNNTRPGTATITAIGMGHFIDSLTTTFTITKAPLPDVSSLIQPESDDILYDGEPHPVTLMGLGAKNSGIKYELMTDPNDIREDVGYLLVEGTSEYGFGYVMGNDESGLGFTDSNVDDNGIITLDDFMEIIHFIRGYEGYALRISNGYYLGPFSDGTRGLAYFEDPVYATISIRDTVTSSVLIQVNDMIFSYYFKMFPTFGFNKNTPQGNIFIFKPVSEISDTTDLGAATFTYINTATGTSSTMAPIEPGTYQVNVTFNEGACYLGGTLENVATFTIYEMNDEDWSSMMALYNGTDGPNWNKTIDMSNVIYARQLIDNNMATIKKGRITSLNLSNMGLVGEIPIEGVYFTALQSLNISNNNLYGNISSFVEPMTSLTTLNVSNNGISELYPPLSANVTNVTIGQQYIPSCQLSIDLKTVDKDELIASIPNIFLYSVNNRDYNSNVTATISAPDNWVGRFLLSNGEFTYQNYSSDNTFKGLSGETYPLEFWNVETSANGVVNLILTFDTGDADFNGAVNVIDLQAIINKIFGVFDSSRPFNYTAANVIVDERLNVQDVVGEVNLLLAQDGSSSKLMQPKAPGSQNQSIVSDAYLYWYNNVLYLSSSQDIAALDISLSGNGEISWNLKDYGLTVSNSNNHIVAYSLSGATIPSGVTAIATAENDAAPEIINAVLSDIDANEVSVNFNSGIITGVDDLINNSDVKIFAAEGGRVMMATSQYLTNVEWQVITIDGRMIAAGNEQNINKDFTTLVSGLNAGVYIVTVYADGKPVSTAKILMQ